MKLSNKKIKTNINQRKEENEKRRNNGKCHLTIHFEEDNLADASADIILCFAQKVSLCIFCDFFEV